MARDHVGGTRRRLPARQGGRAADGGARRRRLRRPVGRLDPCRHAQSLPRLGVEVGPRRANARARHRARAAQDHLQRDRARRHRHGARRIGRGQRPRRSSDSIAALRHGRRDRGHGAPAGRARGRLHHRADYSREWRRVPDLTRRTFDVIVAGGGAAGLMCALRAGQRGRKVLVLEHAEKVGKKILISGGGRCNFTNLRSRPDAFLSANPHFGKSALARYTQHDFIALVDKHRIAWHEKTQGQLFCDGSARQIVALLLDECAATGVEVRVAHRITGVGKADHFDVSTDHGVFTAPSLVLATGGLSIPKMGATGFTYDLARRFGLALVEPRPALVPFTLKVPELSGVSLEVVARLGRVSFREAMLFTHRGLSGPAILQISSYWHAGQEISIDLLPDTDAAVFLTE